MKRKVSYYLLSLLVLFVLGLGVNSLLIKDNYKSLSKDDQITENSSEINKSKENGQLPTKKEEIDRPKEEDLPEEDKGYSKAIISAGGDVMVHLPVANANYNPDSGSYDFSPMFRFIKAINDNSDLSLVNLETVIRLDREISGFPNFNSPREIIPALNYAGFDLIGLANNHSFDQGSQGLADTIRTVEEENLNYIGSNKTLEDVRFRLFEINGIKIGILCYTYGLNGHILEADHQVNILDFTKMTEDIKNLKVLNADKIILFVHWGTEYNSMVTDEMRAYAHEVLNIGVDYILGSHPHVVMPVERVGDEKFIVYSMGNLVSNQRADYLKNPYVEDGLMVRFNIIKNLETQVVHLEKLELIPTWVNKYHTGKWNYDIIPVYDGLNGLLDLSILNDELIYKLESSKMRTESIINGGSNVDG